MLNLIERLEDIKPKNFSKLLGQHRFLACFYEGQIQKTILGYPVDLLSSTYVHKISI